MKVDISFDFGKELCSPNNIVINIQASATLGEFYLIPNLRKAVANAIDPILRHLNMSEKQINIQKNKIIYGSAISEKINNRNFKLDIYDFNLTSRTTGETYTIQDYLDNKIPGLKASEDSKLD